ncbi:hypothetical protein D3C72_1667860 [compost metagenome]
MQRAAARRRSFPLPPGFAEIQAGAEAQLADGERTAGAPAFGQAVAGKEHMPAFEPTIGTAIKVIAKLPGIGHIALVPIEALMGRGLVRFCGGSCHAMAIIPPPEKVNR